MLRGDKSEEPLVLGHKDLQIRTVLPPRKTICPRAALLRATAMEFLTFRPICKTRFNEKKSVSFFPENSGSN